MKYCIDCQQFTSIDKCPTCGCRVVAKRSIYYQDRRLSTIEEEDPFNDNVNRLIDDSPDES